ncbi:hypothetical protein DdX_08786 [Ditylenchus destructor]|uniref:Uncharacterized protein n=1 Tax=Ditylenchus destructor TaxID=166010 RepID=A0AAD4R6V1_9BILA|nr:hypothetical protein DdX_08786 [Ditylenchus destructor]
MGSRSRHLDSIVKKSLPGYYLLKVMLFACLYMKPTLWADKMIRQCKAAGTCSAVQQIRSALYYKDSATLWFIDCTKCTAIGVFDHGEAEKIDLHSSNR